MNKTGENLFVWCAGGIVGALVPFLLFYGIRDLSDPVRQVPVISVLFVIIIFLVLRKRWPGFSKGMLVGVLVGNIAAIWLFVMAAKGALGGGFL